MRTGPVGHPAGPGRPGGGVPAAIAAGHLRRQLAGHLGRYPSGARGVFLLGGRAQRRYAVGALEQHLLASRHPSRGLGILTGTLRTLILLAVLVAVGGVALLVRWPAGLRRRRSAGHPGGRRPCWRRWPAWPPCWSRAHTTPAARSGTPFGRRCCPRSCTPTSASEPAVRIGSSLLVLAGVLWGSAASAGTGPGGGAVGTTPPRRAPRRRLSRGPAGRQRGLAPVAAGRPGRMRRTGGVAQPVGPRHDRPLGAVGFRGRPGPRRIGRAVWVGGLIVLAAVLYGPAPAQARCGRTGCGGAPLLGHRHLGGGVDRGVRRVPGLAAAGLVEGADHHGLRDDPAAQGHAGDGGRRGRVVQPPLGRPAAPARRRYRPAPPRGPRCRDAPSGQLATGAARRAGTARARARPGPAGTARARALPRFRRWLAFEAALAIGVVALTGALIDAAPPQGETAAAAARAFTAHAPVGSDVLSVAVYPLVPGTVHVAVQLTNRASMPVDAFQVTAQLSLPSRQVGPITVPLTHPFTGSWVADSVVVPLGGRWQLAGGRAHRSHHGNRPGLSTSRSTDRKQTRCPGFSKVVVAATGGTGHVRIRRPGLGARHRRSQHGPEGRGNHAGFSGPQRGGDGVHRQDPDLLPVRPSGPRGRPRERPGWTTQIHTAALNPPVNTDDGPITSYVSEVDWSGGSIPPGHFQEFYVLAQQLPTTTDQVVFKALQTYSDGNVVRWIQTTPPGGPVPDHPAPVLTLTAPASSSGRAASSGSGGDTAARRSPAWCWAPSGCCSGSWP